MGAGSRHPSWPTTYLNPRPLVHTGPSLSTKTSLEQCTLVHPQSVLTRTPGIVPRWHRYKATQNTLAHATWTPDGMLGQFQHILLWDLLAHSCFGSGNPVRVPPPPQLEHISLISSYSTRVQSAQRALGPSIHSSHRSSQPKSPGTHNLTGNDHRQIHFFKFIYLFIFVYFFGVRFANI